MPVFKLILLGLLLFGCDDFKEPEAEPTETHHVAPVLEMQEILTDELVSEKIFVAKVKAGDKVYFKIKGWREKSQFRTYTERAESRWTQEKCPDNSSSDNGPIVLPRTGRLWLNPYDLSYQSLPPTGQPWPKPYGPSYHDFDLGGCTYTNQDSICEMRYRRRTQDFTRPIFPEESFLLYPLKVVLGGNFYSLKITFMGREIFVGVLEVTKEMLEISDDLSLEVINPAPGNMEMGFLWYESCPGRHDYTFKMDASTETWVEQDYTRNKFLVSVKLETTS